MKEHSSDLILFVNGKKVVVENFNEPGLTLLNFLRRKLGLCGTKLGCGEGGCGACTVMVSDLQEVQDPTYWSSNHTNGETDICYANGVSDQAKVVRHFSVNACLAPVASLHGMAVTTIEGIGSTRTKLHSVQKQIAESHGSQCGFCTPGIVMSMYTLLRNKPVPKMDDIETYFQGNLCRCTGYRPILEGYKAFTSDATDDDRWAATTNGIENVNGSKDPVNGCQMGQDCCKLQQNGSADDENTSSTLTTNDKRFTPYDPSQEPIFPPELKLNHLKYSSSTIQFGRDLNISVKHAPSNISKNEMSWFRPNSLNELLTLKEKFQGQAKIVVGNTELGVEMRAKRSLYPIMIQPNKVKELNTMSCVFIDGATTGGKRPAVKIGAAVTLSAMEEYFNKLIIKEPKWKTRIFVEIVEMLRWFAGKQIRNVAAVGGNIVTGSPISDLNPIFMASGCSLNVASLNSEVHGDHKMSIKTRTIPFDSKFYTGYRRNLIAPDEVLMSITIPCTSEKEQFVAFKQARRRDDDIAIVNGAFFFDLEEKETGTNIIRNARMAFGGMDATTKMANDTASALIGETWCPQTIEKGIDALTKEMKLPAEAPGAMVRFRQTLAISFLFKAFWTISERSCLYKIPSNYKSATQIFHKDLIKSHQMYEIKPPIESGDGTKLDNKMTYDPVGKPIKHKAADQQSSGEAMYVDDIPYMEEELYAGLVLSEKAHANLIDIDASAALEIEGVVDFVCHKDISPENNKYGVAIVQDETVFPSRKVECVGQIIGIIVAKNQAIAQTAAKKVVVKYEELPAILTMEDAIEAKSFHKFRGDEILVGNKDELKAAFKSSTHVISGEMKTGAQEHFYMETQATLAIPREDNEMELFVSTQNPTETQECIAHALGVPMNKIVCRVKRMGGGFGGKESRNIPISLVVAVAASKVNKPVRLMLDRDDDMVISGTRHPFLGRYKVGFTETGKLTAMEMDIYSNAGCTMDLSFSVMGRAMFHATNSYKINGPMRVKGHVCKTNIPSNTAFRGFGGPQGMIMAENWMEDIARFLDIPAATIRERNLFQQGDKTHYGQLLEECSLQRCWNECKILNDYENASQEIDRFNQENRWKKRGISMVPVMFGISFTASHMNQGGALIQVYRDGSILLSHGGTEMGQGLFTKTIQVASRALGIPHEKIHISETSTDKVPNTSPTAASSGSDINGAAVLDACNKINKRLQPYKDKMPNAKWDALVSAAFFDRVSLSATGFHSTPGIGYDPDTCIGRPFNYYTYGAGVSVVEIDCLTGDHNVLRTDIVMDLGESINPAIDIGQIEGAFIQGYGLFVMEQLIHSPSTGRLLTKGPGAYKIPGFGDIPSEFNVSLLRGTSNPRAVYSSKAVGEPPLFLASSAFFAIKNAIEAARMDAIKSKGTSATLNDKIFKLDAPATSERIRMACLDEFTDKIPELSKTEKEKLAWGIQV